MLIETADLHDETNHDKEMLVEKLETAKTQICLAPDTNKCFGTGDVLCENVRPGPVRSNRLRSNRSNRCLFESVPVRIVACSNRCPFESVPVRIGACSNR